MIFCYLRIDNSGCSLIALIGAFSETIQGRITCDISNNRANLSASVDIDSSLSNKGNREFKTYFSTFIFLTWISRLILKFQ